MRHATKLPRGAGMRAHRACRHYERRWELDARTGGCECDQCERRHRLAAAFARGLTGVRVADQVESAGERRL